MPLLNSPKANFKVSMSKETNKTEKEQIIIIIICHGELNPNPPQKATTES
jgi:hypothetical protein